MEKLGLKYPILTVIRYQTSGKKYQVSRIELLT